MITPENSGCLCLHLLPQQEKNTVANKTAIPLGSKEQCKARNSFCVSASGEYQVKHKQHPKVGKGTLGCCYLGVPGMGNS